MPIGRNDPCPCGSGKKYKKCHGAGTAVAVTSPEASRVKVLKARDVDLGERLMRFARLRYGAHWLQDVLASAGLLVGGTVPESEMPFVVPWLLHMREDSAGVTLAEEWRRDRKGAVAADDRLLLEAYASARVSIWEVSEVEPGVGSRLTDLLTREERFVRDISTSHSLHRFDALFACVLTCDGLSFFGGLHTQPLSPRFAEVALASARYICRVRTRPVPPERLRDPETQFRLLEAWRDAVEGMFDLPLPAMQNTSGDSLVFTRDDFALLAPHTEVAERLASLPGAEEPEWKGGEAVFTIIEPGNETHRSWDNTVVGSLVLSAAGLHAETNSTRRADFLRAVIESHLRGLVRFRLRSEQNTEMLLAAARANAGPTAVQEPVPPEVREAVREFRGQHMSEWLDLPIPALDGLTPRQAAAGQRRDRARLETLLKEFEQSEARLPEEERLDLGWMWETLGVPDL